MMSMNPQAGNPYIGPRAFQDGETLYGRDRELSRLLNLLIAERIVLLYSPSGAGKTSLIQAALMPALREEGFRVLPVIRVGMEPPPDVELPATSNRYHLSTLLSLEEGLPSEQQTPLAELAGMDLTSYLDLRLTDETETDGDVLIFDQFEEILTVEPTNQKAKTEFFIQLGKALRPRDRWALFAMREEYPAGLDPYLRPIPTRLNTTFRLELLGGKAAREAMQEPACQAGVPFSDSAAAKLIDDLRRVQVQQTDGSTAERPGTSIEPVQLQVVCYRLWENLPDDATEIQESDIREAGDVDSALAGYYAERVTAIAETSAVRERRIREWFDRQLITEQGIRGQVLRGPEQSQGLENLAIAPLVDAHLVRAENRRGATWYELAHDRLIEPIRTDNAAWFQANLSTLQHQAALWEQQNRPNGLLLQDEALEEAERWAANHDNDLISGECDFLNACCEARSQRQREYRKNRFIQGLAVVATLIMCVAIYFFIQARDESEKARQAETVALEAKDKAEEAETHAEIRRREAEEARAKTEYQNRVSLVQLLSFQGIFQQEQNKEDERAALLARQAYLFNQKYDTRMLHQVDNALRTVLSTSYFSSIHPHRGDVWSVAFSLNGRLMASGSSDMRIRLWDLKNPNTEPIILRGHKDGVNLVAFSPDGNTLVSGSFDKTVRLWDLTDFDAEPTILYTYEEGVLSIAFSPDGTMLASSNGSPTNVGGNDPSIYLWKDIHSNAKPILLTDHTERVNSVAFSPDGKILASGSDDDTIRLWKLENPTKPFAVLHGHERAVWSVAFSPDGRTLASCSNDKTVRLWDLEHLNTEAVILQGHSNWVISVAFSPDGRTLASGSVDGTIRLWDLTDSGGNPIVLKGHRGNVYRVAFSPDGRVLASGSSDSTVRLWNLAKPVTAPTVLNSSEGMVNSIAFSPDGQSLAAGIWNIWLWDLQLLDIEPSILHGHTWVTSVAFSPDGQLLASGGGDYGGGKKGPTTVKLWDLEHPGSEPTLLHGHEDVVQSVAFSRDGRLLASGSSDNTVRVWNLTRSDFAPVVLNGHDDKVKSVAFSSDGTVLASGSLDKTLRIWDLTHPDSVPVILDDHKGEVFSVAFSPNSLSLASGSNDATIRIWNMENPEAEPNILQSEGTVMDVVFSPDGKIVASASNFREVQLWDLTMPDTPPVALRSPGVFTVAFSPDGKTLASGNRDGTTLLRIWNTETLAAIVCEKVWRNLTMEEWRQFVSPDIPYERTCQNLPVHPSVLETGQNLAKEGDMEGAIAIFQRILELDPGLDFNPQVEARKWSDRGLVKKLLVEGKVQEALVTHTKAQTFDQTFKNFADSWDDLCWYGSLWGYAAEVMDACEQAVSLAPQDFYKRASRGLARALTGNKNGAIEDFQAVVDRTESERVQRWIDALRKGDNPFASKALEALKGLR